VSKEQFRWWKFPIGSGRSFPIKRKDFDLALKAVPVASLHEVVSGPQRYRTPAKYFDAIGLREPRNIDANRFLPLASATWSGIDGGPGTEYGGGDQDLRRAV